jgi:hypothetical protein
VQALREHHHREREEADKLDMLTAMQAKLARRTVFAKPCESQEALPPMKAIPTHDQDTVKRQVRDQGNSGKRRLAPALERCSTDY